MPFSDIFKNEKNVRNFQQDSRKTEIWVKFCETRGKNPQTQENKELVTQALKETTVLAFPPNWC